MSPFFEKKKRLTEELFVNIKSNLKELEEYKNKLDNDRYFNESVYRYYHHSYKSYGAQDYIIEIVDKLKKLAPKEEPELNEQFMTIINEGIDKKFKLSHNKKWEEVVRLIIQALFHAKHMLDMVIKFGNELEEPPEILPYGWATVLYLYNLR